MSLSGAIKSRKIPVLRSEKNGEEMKTYKCADCNKPKSLRNLFCFTCGREAKISCRNTCIHLCPVCIIKYHKKCFGRRPICNLPVFKAISIYLPVKASAGIKPGGKKPE